ncbi:MAG TPA: hypothetical protein VGG74_25445 [Kofleriaceae bacterium]|jgi:hypothetical protein
MKSVRNIVMLTVSLAMLIGTALAEPVHHDTKFRSVPDAKLQIRAVEYDGEVNGTLKVEIKNADKVAHSFVATGLYFVPEGNPDTAPQRLGAVGPMRIGADQERAQVDVPPGKTVEVALDVFCIDSHRGSPSPANAFDVGKSRMPAELSQTIETRAQVAVDTAAKTSPPAAARPAAKAAIQSEVWRARDAKWTKLDGEGKQEAGK